METGFGEIAREKEEMERGFGVSIVDSHEVLIMVYDDIGGEGFGVFDVCA